MLKLLNLYIKHSYHKTLLGLIVFLAILAIIVEANLVPNSLFNQKKNLDFFKHHLKGLDGKNHTIQTETPATNTKLDDNIETVLADKNKYINHTIIKPTSETKVRKSNQMKIVEHTPEPFNHDFINRLKQMSDDVLSENENTMFSTEIHEYKPVDIVQSNHVQIASDTEDYQTYSDNEDYQTEDEAENYQTESYSDEQVYSDHDGEVEADSEYEPETDSQVQTFSMTNKEKRQLKFFVKKLNQAQDCMYPCLYRAYKIESCPKTMSNKKRFKCFNRRMEYIELATPICERICTEEVFPKKQRDVN